MKPSSQKYILLASDYFPNPGGVTQFTFDIAKALKAVGRLDYILTPHPQENNRGFNVKCPKKLNNHRVGSVLVIIQQVLLIRVFIFNRFRSAPSIVLINSLFVNYSWWVLKTLRILKLPYEIIIHGLDIIEKSESNRQELYRVLKDSEQLIINSKATWELFKKYYPQLNYKKYKIVYPCFDTVYLDTFYKAKDVFGTRELRTHFLNLPDDKLVISSICRLVQRKGIDLALKGLSSFLKENLNWVYIIAGDGPASKELQQWVKSEGLSNSVFFLGYISNRQKFDLLNNSSVFIMPNHLMNSKDFEGFGISFLEAQYFENWVIAGKSGGAVEAVDPESGFFVDFSIDPVQQITHYITHIAEYKMVSSNVLGRQYVLENYELEKMTLRFNDVDK